MSEVIEHICPSCGADLHFDPDSQNVKCPYCGSEFPIEEVMKNEGNLELADNGGEQWEESELNGMAEYVCESCGGNLYTESTTSATICPYCGSAVIMKGRLSGTLRPDKVIPFKHSKDSALQKLEEYCGGKKFVPKDFINAKQLEEIKGLYVPFWVYDADIHADITYECVNVRRWTSGDTEYTERKYYRVRRGGDIAFDNIPADASSKTNDELMESIEPFDNSQSVDFTTGYLTGYVADKYDVDQEQVRPRVRQRIHEGVNDAFRSTVHYDEVRTSNSQIVTKNSSVDYVLYPVWLMNTSWKDKKFTFAMNGQTGKMVGNLPADMFKLVGVSLLLFAVGLALVTIGLSVAGGGFSFTNLLIGLAFGAFIGIVFFAFFRKQLNNVEFQHGAAMYIRNNSMNLTVQSDEFLYKRVTTRSRK